MSGTRAGPQGSLTPAQEVDALSGRPAALVSRKGEAYTPV